MQGIPVNYHLEVDNASLNPRELPVIRPSVQYLLMGHILQSSATLSPRVRSSVYVPRGQRGGGSTDSEDIVRDMIWGCSQLSLGI